MEHAFCELNAIAIRQRTLPPAEIGFLVFVKGSGVFVSEFPGLPQPPPGLSTFDSPAAPVRILGTSGIERVAGDQEDCSESLARLSFHSVRGGY